MVETPPARRLVREVLVASRPAERVAIKTNVEHKVAVKLLETDVLVVLAHRRTVRLAVPQVP